VNTAPLLLSAYNNCATHYPAPGLWQPDILAWANLRLDKAQRLSAVEFLEDLSRNTIGKVLKRELRTAYLKQ
jgi:acyl-CoA synthetase (AMP-forming)/AMP-acid ligase II